MPTMPVDKRKVTIKTLLVSVTAPLIVFGMQLLLDGQALQGSVAVVFGVAAAGVFVAFQEYDLPYEAEIRAVVKEADLTTEDVEGLTENVTRQVDSTDASGDSA